MLQIFAENPWLIVVCGGMLIPLAGIVFGTVTSYLVQTKRAELEASLKHEMLQRGMSAEDIKTVMEATSAGARSRAKAALKALGKSMGHCKDAGAADD
jgi:hypothetical protein